MAYLVLTVPQTTPISPSPLFINLALPFQANFPNQAFTKYVQLESTSTVCTFCLAMSMHIYMNQPNNLSPVGRLDFTNS